MSTRKLEIGMRGKVRASFCSQYEMDGHGRWGIVSKPIECIVAGVYERFVLLEFDAPMGVKIRECFYLDDGALDVKWERREGRIQHED